MGSSTTTIRGRYSAATDRYDNPFPDPIGIEAYARLARVHETQENKLLAQELCTIPLNNTWTLFSDAASSRTTFALKAMLEERLLLATKARQKLADSVAQRCGNDPISETTLHRTVYEDFEMCDGYDNMCILY